MKVLFSIFFLSIAIFIYSYLISVHVFLYYVTVLLMLLYYKLLLKNNTVVYYNFFFISIFLIYFWSLNIMIFKDYTYVYVYLKFKLAILLDFLIKWFFF